MFIAHLPAAYLLSRGLLACLPAEQRVPLARRKLLAAGLIGTVIPDIDLFYFYLISDHSVGHHVYWTHAPLFWLATFASTYLLASVPNKPQWRSIALFVCGNALLHLLLDTVASPIRWLYPWSSVWFRLIDIPHRFDWWVLNYLTHWTMLLEIAITTGAGCVALYLPARRKGELRVIGIVPYSLRR